MIYSSPSAHLGVGSQNFPAQTETSSVYKSEKKNILVCNNILYRGKKKYEIKSSKLTYEAFFMSKNDLMIIMIRIILIKNQLENI